MDTAALKQQVAQDTSTDIESFSPAQSGQLTRFLDREDVREGQASAVDQAIGIRTQDSLVDNANNYVCQRTVEFPQPSIAGIGVVTAAGAPDTTRFFFSDKWVVTKPGTGTYRIAHDIGDSKYNVLICPVATTAFTATTAVYTGTYFEVRTFNPAGAAADCAFTFTVYIIP